MPERIQKILSAHGVASRREAEKLITAGRVTVGGKTAELGQRAQPGIDEIAIDGMPIDPKADHVYIMLNKPPGYVTTMSDERGRKTVASLVADAGVRVYPIGRLDMNSEGLLLLTNNGEFANTVAHPSNNISKTYEVSVSGDAAGAITALSDSMIIDSHSVHASSVKLRERTERGGVLSITIHEGRNRQIRKMCAMCGLEVISLKRVSIGNVSLGTLKTGRWRYLSEEEMNLLGKGYTIDH